MLDQQDSNRLSNVVQGLVSSISTLTGISGVLVPLRQWMIPPGRRFRDKKSQPIPHFFFNVLSGFLSHF